MMKNNTLYTGLFLILMPWYAFSGAFNEVGKKLIPGADKKVFMTLAEEKEERFEAYKKMRAELLENEKEFAAQISGDIENIKKEIAGLEAAKKRNPQNEYINKQLEMQVELLQILNERKTIRDQKKNLIDENIKVLKEYLADPELKQFSKDLSEDKAVYSFDEDLLSTHERILDQEKKVASLVEQEANTLAEFESRKRTAAATADTYQTRKEKIKELSGLSDSQEEDLLKLTENVYKRKKDVDQGRLQEIDLKLTLIKTRLFLAKLRLDELQKFLQKIKPQTKVSKVDLERDKQELDKRKQEVFAAKEALRQELDQLNSQLKQREQELEARSRQYSVPLGTDLDSWTREPRLTPTSFLTLAQVGLLNDGVLSLKRKKDFIEARIGLLDEQLAYYALKSAVKESFYKVAEKAFGSEEELAQELKKYELKKVEQKANMALFSERQNALEVALTTQKRAFENIQQLKQQADQSGIFKDHQKDYNQFLALIREAAGKIQEQIGISGSIANIYTDIIGILTNARKRIDFIVSELSLITYWGRPEHAISWKGIRSIVPDMRLFAKDVYSYVKSISIATLMRHVQMLIRLPVQLFYFLIIFILTLFFIASLGKILPRIARFLLSVEDVPFGIRWLCKLGAVLLGFVLQHLYSISFLILAYFSLWFYPYHDQYAFILFYLALIPYCIYLSNRFITYLIQFNKTYDYILFSKDYKHRFITVLSTMLYATVCIMFFREAFILGDYRASELPNILLTVNFIVFQLGLILLISKEQILRLIPTRTDFWRWIHEQVDTYYYLLLLVVITIIVMSNPYVGFGRLVLVVLRRLLYTVVLAQVLLWFQEWAKRASSEIFFVTDQDVTRDRFPLAKTWYGLLVIALFALCAFVGLLVFAHIWNWPEAVVKISKWSDIVAWIKTPIALQDTANPFSVFSLIQVILFILGGAGVWLIIDRFVLQRIFDIFLVEPGIQDTVSSFTKYIIVITAGILGLQAIGLGGVIVYLGGLLVVFSWLVKEPASDLLAYFIILVQRPIKVGDYIKLDENTMGFVRRITPRSVELRRRNSTTLIVPNTQVINKTVTNWNYVRGYFAFDDILLTVAYKEDPAMVREMILRILDESPVLLKNPKPIVWLDTFGEIGYVFRIRGYLSSTRTREMWELASGIKIEIARKLKEQNVELASAVRFLMDSSHSETIE